MEFLLRRTVKKGTKAKIAGMDCFLAEDAEILLHEDDAKHYWFLFEEKERTNPFVDELNKSAK